MDRRAGGTSSLSTVTSIEFDLTVAYSFVFGVFTGLTMAVVVSVDF